MVVVVMCGGGLRLCKDCIVTWADVLACVRNLSELHVALGKNWLPFDVAIDTRSL
jgi:hypothetical protein